MPDAYNKDEFLSLFGMEALVDSGLLQSTERATVAIDPENAALRGLSVEIEPEKKGFYTLSFKYKYYVSGYKPKEVELANISFRDMGDDIKLDRAYILGKRLSLKEDKTRNLLATLSSKLIDQIVKKDLWVNPIEFLSDHRFKEIFPHRISKKLSGLYASGDFNTKQGGDLEPQERSGSDDNQGPSEKPKRRKKAKAVLPATMLNALVGYYTDQFKKGEERTKSITIHGDKKSNVASATLQYVHKQGKKGARDFEVEGFVLGRDKGGSSGKESFYRLKVQAVPGSHRRSQISHLELFGKKIDLNDQEAVYTVLETIGRTNKMIDAGKSALIDDLEFRAKSRHYPLPMELMLYLNTYDHINEEQAPYLKKGYSFVRACGGNNIRTYISDVDDGIGANQYMVGHEKLDPQTNKMVGQYIGIDAGVHFHEEFDVTMHNFAPHLYHKTDKSHVPTHPFKVLPITHRHQDHVGDLPYAVKAGYQMPPLIMNGKTKLQFIREMRQLDVSQEDFDDALAMCHIIDFEKDIDRDHPDARHSVKVGDTVIEQWTHEHHDFDLNKKTGERTPNGETHYYPRLKIDDIKIMVGPMPHSDPGMMILVETPDAKVLYTGDFKYDETSRVPLPKLTPFLHACDRPDYLISESTRADQKDEGPTWAEVEDDLAQTKVKLKEDGKRIITSMLGSNHSMLLANIAASGRAGIKTIIVDGKALEDLVLDLDKLDGIKKWAFNEFGVELLTKGQKRAKEILESPGDHTDYELFVTGPNDDDFSTLNRLVRESLPKNRPSLCEDDAIIISQNIIPIRNIAYRRKMMAEAVEQFHGAMILQPETIEKQDINRVLKGEEGKIEISTSGHSAIPGKTKLIQEVDPKAVGPNHGNEKQIKAHAALVKKLGREYVILDGNTDLKVGGNESPEPLRGFLSDILGVTSHLPSKDAFFLKGLFTMSAMKKQPILDMLSAKLMYQFEKTARREAGVDSKHELVETLPASLSPVFNRVSDHHGYLANNIPFGIEKYPDEDVLEAKNIHVLGFLDEETGGLNTRKHLTREHVVRYENTKGDVLEETQIFQSIPTYRAPSPMALLVTNTNPYDLQSGVGDNLEAREFSQIMKESIKDAKTISYIEALKQGKAIKKKDAKAVIFAHNMGFDSGVITNELGRNLHLDRRPHQTHGVIAADTKAVSRALYAFAPNGQYNTVFYEGTDIPNHTLGALCDANSVVQDKYAAHGALADVKTLSDVYKVQDKALKPIIDQTVLNADKSTGHLLNDLRGANNGVDGPASVFSYISPFASRPKPQMGAFVGTFKSQRYALVINLKYDPEKILRLPPEEIIDILLDSKDERLELFDLTRNPLIYPASFGLKVRANGNLSKGSLDARANTVRKHVHYIDPTDQWQNLPNKLSDLHDAHQKEIFKARLHAPYFESDKPLPEYSLGARTPEKGVVALMMMNHPKFKVHYQEVVKRVREYSKALQSGKKSNMTQAYRDIRALRDLDVYKYDKDVHIGAVMDLVNNVHYDQRPKDLWKADKHEVEMMRHYMGWEHFKVAKEEMATLESDQEQYEKFIGTDPKKLKLFKTIKKWLKEEAPKFDLTDDVRDFVVPSRKVTRPANSNHNFPKQDVA